MQGWFDRLNPFKKSINTNFNVHKMEGTTAIGAVQGDLHLNITNNKFFSRNEAYNYSETYPLCDEQKEEKESEVLSEESRTKLYESVNTRGKIISGPAMRNFNAMRSDLITDFKTQFDELTEINKKISVSGLVGIGKHYFIHQFSQELFERNKYQFVIWFDKFYGEDEVHNKLLYIKKNFLDKKKSENIAVADILDELIKQKANNKKLLLILNCGYFDYHTLEHKDIIENTFNSKPNQIDVILISRIHQSFPSSSSKNFLVNKMSHEIALVLITEFLKDTEIKADKTLFELIIKACLYHPALIVRYGKYLKENPKCQEYKSLNSFPFPFLDNIWISNNHITSPTLPSLKDFSEIKTPPASPTNSSKPHLYRYIWSYSRSDLVNKTKYSECIRSAVEFANKELKKNLTDTKKISILDLLDSHFFSSRKNKITKAEIQKLYEQEGSSTLIGENFAEIARKYFLICEADSKNAHEVIFEEIVLQTLKPHGITS